MEPGYDFPGRTVLVTGAISGIGVACARRLAIQAGELALVSDDGYSL